MRRPLSVLCALALGVTGVALSATAPATAAPAPQASPTAAAAVPDELLVGYGVGATEADKSRARGRAGATRQEGVVTASGTRKAVELVRLPAGKNRDQAIAQLQSDASVAYAEPNWVYTTNGKPGAGGTTPPPPADYFTNGSLWGMDARNSYGSQASTAWAAGHTGSASVVVGVIDEGIQFDHPDLAGQVWTNPFDPANGVDDDGNGYVDDIHGWDFDGNNNTVYDGGSTGALDDHGTHVSGTIGGLNQSTAAVPTIDKPQVGVVGINQHVTIISTKFLGRRGGTTANAVKAVDYLNDLKSRHGMNIVASNNSWGGGGFSQALSDAVDRANTADILFIAAAGNGGSDGVGDNNDAVASYPSNLPQSNVIAVAAIDKFGAIASFSNYGKTTVDVGAPGVAIWSSTAYNIYESYSGTSMATPHVTGAAALYKSTHPTATAADIKAAILNSAVATASLAGKTVTGGRLNVSGF